MNSDLSLGVYLQTIGVEPNRHNSFPNCLDAISNLLNSINAEFMSACVRSIRSIDVLTHKTQHNMHETKLKIVKKIVLTQHNLQDYDCHFYVSK